MNPNTGEVPNGPHRFMRPIVEFAVVFGLCLAVLFIVIPEGTVESENIGLSPRLLPVVTVSTIALLSVVTFVSSLLRRKPPQLPQSRGLLGAALLALATAVGIVVIDHTGVVYGGTALVILCCLAIGERQLVRLAGMGSAALVVLLLVELSGL